MAGPLICGAKPLLKGVPGDMSEVSSRLEVDMFRLRKLLRLDEEYFFLNAGGKMTGELARLSMASPSPLSAEAS